MLLLAATAARGEPASDSLLSRPWFEARTPNFHLDSCGATREVRRLAERLEQFRNAYSRLAGAEAVASPPIIVIAFPDQESMGPFLPLYQGRAADLGAFFSRGSDENLIVLALSKADAASLRTIYHEYSHLLFRHQQAYWPMWLCEGMAEIYSTFEVKGREQARLGLPIDRHLSLLAEAPMWSLSKLFSVTRGSPEYNERRYNGIFYAESWLLTHYLLLGDNADYRTNFPQLTVLLRQGQSPEQAFTNAFHTSLPGMQADLARYLARGKFKPLTVKLSAAVDLRRACVTQSISPAEVCFRLGDELLHIGRFDAAEWYFRQGEKLAPNSPLPCEGLGFLVARRGQPAEAVNCFRKAQQLGQLSYLALFASAQQQCALAAGGPNLRPLEPAAAAEVRAELEQSLALMPDFGPAHHLLGALDLVQGHDLADAERHIRRATELEPENQAYSLALAQVEFARGDTEAARITLEALRLGYVAPDIRARAAEMLKALAQRGEPAR